MLRGQAVTKFRVQGRELRPVTVPGRGRKAHELALRLQSLQEQPFPLGSCTALSGSLDLRLSLGPTGLCLYPHWTREG